MKKLLLAVCVSFLFFSCDLDINNEDKKDTVEETQRSFWAIDATENDESYYKVQASLLAVGRYCKVWVEDGSGVDENTARSMANEYDNNIYQKMMSAFGTYANYGYNGKIVATNTMELADWYGDGDKKLCILLLDIKDGYKNPGDSSIGGYFWGVNLLANDPNHEIYKYSNECDMIYVDTYPGIPGSENSNRTLAHEMQHLMNVIQSAVCGRNSAMDIWINEGLSAAAEYVYSGKIDAGRVSWFNRDQSGLIKKGNNFFVWDNRGNESPNAVLDDYATVSLFFQWLRLQSGGIPIYKDIITSPQSNHMAVVNALNKRTSNAYSNWGTLLETWLAANSINHPSNQYGYKGAVTVTVAYAPASPTTVRLYPGEGVYSLANTNPSVTSSGNIVYKYISGSNVNTSHSSGSTLLTYNKNTDIAANTENGTVTGLAPAASVSIASSVRMAEPMFSDPYRIDIGDLLRRGGKDGGFLNIAPSELLIKGAVIDE